MVIWQRQQRRPAAATATEPALSGALRFVGAGSSLGVDRPLDAKTFERGLGLQLVGRRLGRRRGA